MALACIYTGRLYLQYVPSTGITILFITLSPVSTPAETYVPDVAVA